MNQMHSSIKMSSSKITESRLQYFIITLLSLVALRYAGAAYFSRPAATGGAILDAASCQTHDLPNPIASLYPNNATGTLNGTVAVLPISLDLARSIIPPQYRILEHAYRAILPSFPKDMYPAILQAVHDHEVQAFGYKIPDFTVRHSPFNPHTQANSPAACRHRISLPRPPHR